jgi:plasmid stabilization system protein ParE
MRRKRYVLSRLAADDIDDIWDFIAKRNIDAADRVIDELYRAIRKLAEMPQIGHVREDLADRTHRFWPVRDFLIIYHPDTKPLEVVRVLRGARDIPGLL